MGIIDTHAHYDDEKFEGDRDEVIRSLSSAGRKDADINPLGISYVINCASDLASSAAGLRLCERYAFFRFAAGVHPHEAASYDSGSADKITTFLKSPYAVALGEIGLDYHYDFSSREKQREVFAAQLSLAGELGFPVVVHDREAHGDVMNIISAYPGTYGVMHSFSGSREMVRELVKRGYYISYSGSVTFKNADRLRETVSSVPLDRLLVETDSPYLAPVPYRGRRNDSRFIYSTLCTISGLIGKTPEEAAKITSENAKRLFGADNFKV
ncbi:MAG: TatD family hydrolase [Oscillospiraceae bacterium]|nr:TatD family hydrolase [Oscillospiraceae bacterium]